MIRKKHKALDFLHFLSMMFQAPVTTGALSSLHFFPATPYRIPGIRDARHMYTNINISFCEDNIVLDYDVNMFSAAGSRLQVCAIA